MTWKVPVLTCFMLYLCHFWRYRHEILLTYSWNILPSNTFYGFLKILIWGKLFRKEKWTYFWKFSKFWKSEIAALARVKGGPVWIHGGGNPPTIRFSEDGAMVLALRSAIVYCHWSASLPAKCHWVKSGAHPRGGPGGPGPPLGPENTIFSGVFFR